MSNGKQRAKRPCLVSSCAGFASNAGYCARHQDRIRKQDQARGNSHQRGYDHEWRKARDIYLKDNPLCVVHSKNGMFIPATVVDHIDPHKGDKDKFWDKTNWQSLCESCHNRKTASEDRGAWSPSLHQVQQQKPTAEMNFKIGDVVVCTNPVMQTRLDCDEFKQWEILDIIRRNDQAALLEITDGDVIKQIHYSHFSKKS